MKKVAAKSSFAPPLGPIVNQVAYVNGLWMPCKVCVPRFPSCATADAVIAVAKHGHTSSISGVLQFVNSSANLLQDA
jgi:hypothetical protein